MTLAHTTRLTSAARKRLAEQSEITPIDDMTIPQLINAAEDAQRQGLPEYAGMFLDRLPSDRCDEEYMRILGHHCWEN